ncbi:MAG: hypothetical protein HYX68_13730 [Planctomycetes bacterium]|nr:hypothetical protein [Planctomycetota bacterium]
MLVDPKDGRCRSCDSQLEIVGVDDISMTVTCAECGDTYTVETDAFGDGCMTYYVGFMAGRLEGGDDDDA